jgi:hypothetical protein
MPMPERDRRLVWRISALLLDYPGADLLAAIDEISCAVTELPDEVRVHLTEFVAYLRATVSLDLTARYVETFDLRRRASLHLTFFARTRYARRQPTRSGSVSRYPYPRTPRPRYPRRPTDLCRGFG